MTDIRRNGGQDLAALAWASLTGACVVVAIAALAACTPAALGQGATSLCAAAGDSLQVLAGARKQGKLSPADIQTVYDAEILIAPVCTANVPPTDPAAAAASLADGLAKLATLKMQVAP